MYISGLFYNAFQAILKNDCTAKMNVTYSKYSYIPPTVTYSRVYITKAVSYFQSVS